MQTCKDCQHWVGRPAMVDAVTGKTFQQGECHGQPPVPVLVPILDKQGNLVQLKQMAVTYPLLNDDTQMCAVFKQRLLVSQ